MSESWDEEAREVGGSWGEVLNSWIYCMVSDTQILIELSLPIETK